MPSWDLWLDHVNVLKHRHHKELAAVEAARAETIWELEYVAQLAQTMVNAPHTDRERCATEITAVMRNAGHWDAGSH
ncbi:hypothetical protein [Agromyces aureus]|uniref:hypothetical protein n=1 Tax=Agromyces aureus TaxID=453304 RepID=UPI000B21B959|nr:hypothetical protein [Agromyces aureus]